MSTSNSTAANHAAAVKPELICTWEMFQAWVKTWNDYNFPGKLPHQPLLGVVEECCAELFLTLESPPSSREDLDSYYDAIGDTLVYLADYCNQAGISMLEAVTAFSPKPWDSQTSTTAFQALAIYCGQLCHAHLKTEQKIRASEKHHARKINSIGGIVFHLGRLPALPCTVFMLAVTTFAEVVKRDWVTYPENGFPPIPDLHWRVTELVKDNGPRVDIQMFPPGHLKNV